MVKKTELILAGLGFTADESSKIVETGVIRFYPRNSIVLAPPFTSESLFIKDFVSSCVSKGVVVTHGHV